MSILSGYGKFKRYVLTSTGYRLCSQWTSSNTVHFDDGKTAQTKLGAISGITDSLTATSSNVALSAKAGKSLQDQVTELNTGLKEMTSADDIINIYENNYDLKGYGIKCGVIKEIRFNLIVSLPYNTWKAVAKIKDKYFFPNFIFFSIFSTSLGNPVALQINVDGTISLYAFSDAVTGDQLYITVTYI